MGLPETCYEGPWIQGLEEQYNVYLWNTTCKVIADTLASRGIKADVEASANFEVWKTIANGMMTDEEIAELHQTLSSSATKPFLLHSFRGISGIPAEQARIVQLNVLLLYACHLWSRTAWQDGETFQKADGVSDTETVLDEFEKFSDNYGMQYRNEAVKKGVPIDDVLADI